MDATGDWADSQVHDSAPTRTDWPQIPGYEITAEIAKGGMGRVYAGRDLTLDREVAVKTILPGADPERFVTEARVTARLPHPGVPPVHALGTLPNGGHYLVMKLIRGRTLAALLKRRTDQRSELPRFVQVFEQVAQAVGFAHSNHILHRDLKPLNVMVGEFGEVQVMDWGLAKDAATGHNVRPEEPQPTSAVFGQFEAMFDVRTEEAQPGSAEHTAAGTVMGTPGYMAPEQARGEVVDARADVFALGSLLTTILTGKPAFVGATARETVDRAAAADLTDAFTRLNRCQADEELVALARKCLAPHLADRPADGRAVAVLVAEYRAGVEARLQRAETDRARAEARAAEQRKRRRAMQRAGGVVAAVLVCGIVGTSVGLVRANRAAESEREANVAAQEAKIAAENAATAEAAAKVRAQDAAAKEKAANEQAQREKAVALGVRDFLQQKLLRQVSPWEHSRWAFKNPDRAGSTSARRDLTVRELLDRASKEFAPEVIDTKFPGQPLVQAEILETIGETYEGLKDYKQAARFVGAAHALREKHLTPDNSATLVSHVNLVFVNLSASNLHDALTGMLVLIDRLDSLLQQLPQTGADGAERRAEILAVIDTVQERMKQRANPHTFLYPTLELGGADTLLLLKQAERTIARTRELARAFRERFGPNDPRTLLADLWVGFCHQLVGQAAKARVVYEDVLARAEIALAPDDPVIEGLHEVLAVTYATLDIHLDRRIKWREIALDRRLRTLGENHPATWNAFRSLASEHQDAGNFPEAIKLLEQLRDAMSRTLGADHADTLLTLEGLAEVYLDGKRVAEAIALYELIHEKRTKADGADHPGTLAVAHDLAWALKVADRSADAIRLYERVAEARTRVLGAEHSDTLVTLNNLAVAYQDVDRVSEAIDLFERVRDARVKTLGAEHIDTLSSVHNLAAAYREARKLPDAIKQYELARAGRTKVLGAEHPDTLTTVSGLAEAYRLTGRTTEAIRLQELVLAARTKAKGPDHVDTIDAAYTLAVAYRSARRFNDAIKLFERARDADLNRYGPEHKETLRTLHNLGYTYDMAARWDDAITTYLQARTGYVKLLGADHPLTLITSSSLGATYFKCGRLQDSIDIYEQVRDARVKALGADHTDTQRVLRNLALSASQLAWQYRSAGKIPEAVAVLERFRAGQVKALGADHPESLSATEVLASLYYATGSTEKAFALFEEAATAVEKRQFKDAIAGTIIRRTVDAYEGTGHFDKAEGWRRKWLAAVKERSGPTSPIYASELRLLGLNLLRQRKWAGAELVLRECLNLLQERQPNTASTFDVQSMLGEALVGRGQLADAEPLLLKSYEGLNQQRVKPLLQLADAANRLISLYTALDKPDEVAKWRTERAKYPVPVAPRPREVKR